MASATSFKIASETPINKNDCLRIDNNADLSSAVAMDKSPICSSSEPLVLNEISDGKP